MRSKFIVISLLLIFVFTLSGFGPHKFYVSVNQLVFVPEKRSIQITSRFFIDDLNQALELAYGETFFIEETNNSGNQFKKFQQYFDQKFKISVNGKPQPIVFLAKEVEADVLVCYFLIKDIKKVSTLEIYNKLLMDLLPDQQHIFHTNVHKIKKSTLLTKGNASELLKY
jgi:SpoU rRNA methylase family enzyme